MTPLSISKNTVRIHELYRSKISGGVLSVAHAGVGFEDYLGNKVVLHRTPDRNTHLSSYSDFAANQEVTIKTTLAANKNIIERAQHILENGHTYAALTNNCEHLVDFVLGRKMASEQVRNTTITTLGSFGLFHLMDMPIKTQLIAAGLVGAFSFWYTKNRKLK